ncbi:hypothetical protein [Streptomyces marincola]|uniref:DUF732 domain-containing protein n=1 Tax=Streptomyces marincola TaxID=2878388 RepID=A0A1W7D1Z9_9ACTN|nr:hypothetical protein [Streptomyces marincola]ARQ71108.1 hypothetical protein CAG99_21830 [Streptomyces marincola]
MRGARARRAARLAAALAAVLAVAACGGDGGSSGTAPEASAPGSPAPSSPAATPEAPGGPAGEADGPQGQPEGHADSPPGGPPDETVPPEQPLPPGEEFTEEQREYLSERVPEGVDPAAILELGTETCERIGYLHRNDREAAVAALRGDELPGAREAIEHLCPEHADLLTEARGEE